MRAWRPTLLIPRRNAMGEANEQTQEQDGRADFDFQIGRWKLHHRRLRERLKGSMSWEEFEGTSIARKFLGGLGIIDEATLNRTSGSLEGMTVRLFDPQSQQWSVYFADSVHGTLATPMI